MVSFLFERLPDNSIIEHVKVVLYFNFFNFLGQKADMPAPKHRRHLTT